jgi:SAM-dependent methyltransferase
MEDLRKQTVDTYNKSAAALAEYFKGIGPRIADIDLAFELAGNPSTARVLEIGCGDGRDAKEIVARAEWFKGFDISESLIELARQTVPGSDFEVADARTYEYPKNLDVVFAFASLLHLDKDEVQGVLEKVHEALNPNGIFYLSLKEKPEYMEEVKDDQYGRRLFYFYNADIISAMAENLYEVAAHTRKTIGHTDWFELALRKI